MKKIWLVSDYDSHIVLLRSALLSKRLQAGEKMKTERFSFLNPPRPSHSQQKRGKDVKYNYGLSKTNTALKNDFYVASCKISYKKTNRKEN